MRNLRYELRLKKLYSPAETRHSLFASASSFAFSNALRVGFKPATPTIAAMEISTGIDAASIKASSPAPHCIFVPFSASFNSWYFSSHAVAANSTPNSIACLARRAILLFPVSAVTR